MVPKTLLVGDESKMIDGLFKRHIDPLWEGLAKPLARHCTANQVTIVGLLAVMAVSAAFLLHGSTLWFGIGLIVAFSADSLDGAVARLRGEASPFGGYLDAIIDRYQELAVLVALALKTGHWPAAFFVLAGSFLTSYAKARTAVEVQISNSDWPDLFERQERIIFFCAMLIFDGVLTRWFSFGIDVILPGLWVLAALCHVTAIQRFLRARTILKG
jgi:archaetidylinositol phosphate synthase